MNKKTILYLFINLILCNKLYFFILIEIKLKL